MKSRPPRSRTSARPSAHQASISGRINTTAMTSADSLEVQLREGHGSELFASCRTCRRYLSPNLWRKHRMLWGRSPARTRRGQRSGGSRSSACDRPSPPPGLRRPQPEGGELQEPLSSPARDVDEAGCRRAPGSSRMPRQGVVGVPQVLENRQAQHHVSEGFVRRFCRVREATPPRCTQPLDVDLSIVAQSCVDQGDRLRRLRAGSGQITALKPQPMSPRSRPLTPPVSRTNPSPDIHTPSLSTGER